MSQKQNPRAMHRCLEPLEDRRLFSLPADPSGLAVRIGAVAANGDPTQENISWTSTGTGATKFNVYRSSSPNVLGTFVKTVQASGAATDSTTDAIVPSNASADNNPPVYFYTVRSADAANQQSPGATQAFAPQMYWIEGYQDNSGAAVQSAYANLKIELHYYPDAAPPSEAVLPSYGPLALSGFSFGGNDAVKVAAGLHRTVNYLALVDPVPNPWPTSDYHVNGSFPLSANVTYADDFYNPNRNEDFYPSGPIVGSPANYTNYPISDGAHGQLVWDPSVQNAIQAKVTGLTWTLPVNGAVSPTPPAAPYYLSATALTGTSVRLTWGDNNPAGAETGVQVMRADGYGTNYAPVGSPLAPGTTTYTDATAAPNTVYTYEVIALNGAAQSPPSNTSSVATPAGGSAAPAAPFYLSAAAASSTSVHLTWGDNNAAGAETGVQVMRADGYGTNYAPVGSPLAPGTTTYTDTTVAPNTVYTYEVVALNGAAQSPPSNTSSVATPGGSPATPAAPYYLSAVAASSSSVRLTWADNNAGSAETGVQVWRADGFGTNGTLLFTQTSGVNAWTDTSVVAGHTYTYYVKAINGNAISGASNTSSVNV